MKHQKAERNFAVANNSFILARQTHPAFACRIAQSLVNEKITTQND